MSLQFISGLIAHYGYFFLLPVAIIEGPIVTVIASFLASQGILNVYIVYIIAVFGDFIGDSLWYFAARNGREHFLQFLYKHCHFLGITEERIGEAEEHLHQHFYKTVAIGKITNMVMLPIILACGVLKVDYKKFITATLSLDIPKDLVFILIGFYFGKYVTSINSGINKFYAIATAFLLIIMVVIFCIKFIRSYFYQHAE